ncbi:ankyrin repeat domain-containing protein 50-like [Haliotis rufescens]|uniref:ankyrin repeat domain-containing protein 50-like n=1 Tax=Haliotis rufescens TaxID=6454 RepID=UPI00201F11EF|nr:ankyrin repeat domain-containing protein 50-like [Haliotis rufescens]
MLFVPLTTQDCDQPASSDPSQDPSQNERDPLISTASHATPSQAARDLFYASKAGDLEEVKRLLTTAGVSVNCRVEGSWTPVMVAAYWEHKEVVELLVSRGADVSLVDEDGNNTLHFACMREDVKTVKFVLSQNVVDIDGRGCGSRTPVMEAARAGHKEVVELLVSEGADVSLVDVDGNNTLHFACMRRDVEMVMYVLSLNVVDINSRGLRSMTPVMMEALYGHRDVDELLVSIGADVSLVDEDGNNIFHYASRGGDVGTVKYVLLLNVVDIDARNNSGETAADVARLWGHQPVLDLLVSRGAQ